MKFWRDIPGFERIYQAHRHGFVRKIVPSSQLNADGILTAHLTTAGYPRVHLYKDKVDHRICLHKLIAMTYWPNPDNLKEVNHLDGIKKNAAWWNLRWTTHSDNVRHSYRELRSAKVECPF